MTRSRYRQLFLVTSRYSYMNTLAEVMPSSKVLAAVRDTAAFIEARCPPLTSACQRSGPPQRLNRRRFSQAAVSSSNPARGQPSQKKKDRQKAGGGSSKKPEKRRSTKKHRE
jgi:hypothetical protein|eukprot:COSAG01_NODE_17489_length_1147_cov_1.620229_2_plen_112_part_00